MTAIPQSQLEDGREFRNEALPFAVRVNKYYPNSRVGQRDGTSTAPAPATQGFGPRVVVQEVPLETQMDRIADENTDAPVSVARAREIADFLRYLTERMPRLVDEWRAGSG